MAVNININIDKNGGGGGGGGMPAELAVSTTYAELKALRDGGTLVPGTWYRITDYLCSTTQSDTQAAQHQFDIIVQALDESHLSEEAYAAHHEGDTYFANSKLEAWKLKYCLDNDTTRFGWAADGSGGETQYYIEFENQEETIRLYRTGIITPDKDEVWVYESGKDTYYTGANPQAGDSIYSDDTLETVAFTITNVGTETTPGINGKGVVYYMKDEWDNECPYDFKSIMFNRLGTMVYTFASINNNTVTDASLSFNYDMSQGIGSGAGSNVIKELIKGVRMLNDNVIMYNGGNLACFGNIFEENCSGNTLSHQCNMNKFSQGCSGNQFSQNCYYNQFSQYCSNNQFSQECNGNQFSQSCNNNSFSQGCSYNQFSQGCCDNQFSQYCQNNTFSQYCSNNQFSQGCFGNQFSQNCQSNTFSQECYEVILPESSHHFRLQPGVHSIEVVATGNDGDPQYVHILSGVAGSKGSSVTVTIAKDTAYTQMVGMDSNGTMQVWNPADAAS